MDSTSGGLQILTFYVNKVTSCISFVLIMLTFPMIMLVWSISIHTDAATRVPSNVHVIVPGQLSTTLAASLQQQLSQMSCFRSVEGYCH